MAELLQYNDRAGFHQFHDQDGTAYGSFEVFYDDADDAGLGPRNFNEDGTPVQPGWYWWTCQPGCLPDGDAKRPFDTSTHARIDADS